LDGWRGDRRRGGRKEGSGSIRVKECKSVKAGAGRWLIFIRWWHDPSAACRERRGTSVGMTDFGGATKYKERKAYTEIAESTEFTEKRNPRPR